MEQPATAPATSNAIRGAEQSDNIVKQRLLGWWKRLDAFHGNLGGSINKWQEARHSGSIETTSIAMIVVRSRVTVILREIPLGRRTGVDEPSIVE